MARGASRQLRAFEQRHQQPAGLAAVLGRQLVQVRRRGLGPVRQHGITHAAQLVVFRAQVQHHGADGTALAEAALVHAAGPRRAFEQACHPACQAGAALQGLAELPGHEVAIDLQGGRDHLRLARREVVVQRALGCLRLRHHVVQSGGGKPPLAQQRQGGGDEALAGAAGEPGHVRILYRLVYIKKSRTP
jgi:hypothetical protein